MRISEMYPSKYFRAVDLEAGPKQLAIKRVSKETLGDSEKPVIEFHNDLRGFVLNKTNSKLIAAAYGDDTDKWIGRRITLAASSTDFHGKTVPAIRVELDSAEPAKPAPAEKNLNDEIPF
jgi:hypothetical protein